MILYLIDANVLIRAHADYYPIDRIFPFWEWLLEQAVDGRIAMPHEIYNAGSQIFGSSGAMAPYRAGREGRDHSC